MNEEVYLKNLVRKIIEFNQKIDHCRKVTALGRDDITDRQIKKERENIIAQLDMSNIIDRVEDNHYKVKYSGFDYPLKLLDINENNTIYIDSLEVQ